ncbi:hypothetical protein VTO42DRAFT_7582 [Malbranchea cinnamomea]
MAPVYSTLLLCSLGALSALAQNVSPTYTDDARFEEAILTTANRYRSEHGAPDLTWNDTLATRAADWARQCRWRYNFSPSGETLARGFNSANEAVESWGNQRDRYDFDRPGFSFRTSDFTQLVWVSSTSVGCARHDCGPPRGDDDDDHDDRYERPDYDRDDAYDRADDRYDDRYDRDDDDYDDRFDDDRFDDDRFDDDRFDDDRFDDDDRDDRKTRRGFRRSLRRRDDDDDRAYGWFVVCNYSPPGNILGGSEFRDNVLPRGSAGSGDNTNGGNTNNNNNNNRNGGHGNQSNEGGGNGGSGGQQGGVDESRTPPSPSQETGAAMSRGANLLALWAAVTAVLGMI